MRKKMILLWMMGALSLLLSACGPSGEKVEEAQQKYTQLAKIHNQVVEAHQEVSDNSLDQALLELRDRMKEAESYNLTEMADEEIDALIQNMDTLMEDYEEILTLLGERKEEEAAAVLTPVFLTLVNQTGNAFTELKLYEQGDAGVHENVLSGLGELAAGEMLTGLVIQRDTQATPWMLELKGADGIAYEFLLSVENYDEEGTKLTLTLEPDTEKLVLTEDVSGL